MPRSSPRRPRYSCPPAVPTNPPTRSRPPLPHPPLQHPTTSPPPSTPPATATTDGPSAPTLNGCALSRPPPRPANSSPAASPSRRTPHRSPSPRFKGPPNAIQIVPGRGWHPTIVEGGPSGDRELPPNSRIRVGDIECTALPDNGFGCTTPDAAFRFHDNTLTARGQAAAPAATPPLPTPLDGPYDNHRDRWPRHSVRCSDRRHHRQGRSWNHLLRRGSRHDHEIPRPATGPRRRQYQQPHLRRLACMSPTAAMAADLGYSISCRNETTATHLTTPVGPVSRIPMEYG